MREHWGSRFGFIQAAGSATGKIWLWVCRTITPLAVAIIIIAEIAGIG